jgi:hypothetical protein
VPGRMSLAAISTSAMPSASSLTRAFKERQQPIAGAQFRARTQEAERQDQCLDKLLVAAGLARAIVDQTCELAVGRRTERGALQRARPVARTDESGFSAAPP